MTLLNRLDRAGCKPATGMETTPPSQLLSRHIIGPSLCTQKSFGQQISCFRWLTYLSDNAVHMPEFDTKCAKSLIFMGSNFSLPLQQAQLRARGGFGQLERSQARRTARR